MMIDDAEFPLKDPDADVRLLAARVLEQIGPAFTSAAIPALNKALQDPSADVPPRRGYVTCLFTSLDIFIIVILTFGSGAVREVVRVREAFFFQVIGNQVAGGYLCGEHGCVRAYTEFKLCPHLRLTEPL